MIQLTIVTVGNKRKFITDKIQLELMSKINKKIPSLVISSVTGSILNIDTVTLEINEEVFRSKGHTLITKATIERLIAKYARNKFDVTVRSDYKYLP